MPIAAAIEAVLNKENIDFAIIEAHPTTLASQGAIKTTLLQDAKGKLQVYYSADSLLDINAVCKLTQRELKATSSEDVENICTKLQLERLTTVPGALEYDMVIDQSLIEVESYNLDSGTERNIIAINNTQFKQLIRDAAIGDISIHEHSLQTSTLDDIDDVEQITVAVANFTQLRIKQRLEETLEFPPLPDTAQRIIKLRADPNADIQDLTDIVESDPPLAAQVVSWAASPYYAAPGKIKSIHDAIVRVLGFDLVLNLSLGLALGKTLSMPKDAPKGFSSYWQQAVYAAATVEALVGAIPPKSRPTMGMAYLSGLLHNFGYLILAQVFPPHFSSICRYQEANPFSNHSLIERHILGVTREQLGSWLMRTWNMPEEVSNGLRFQNEKSYEDDDSAYANLVFVAMRLLRKHGIGNAPLEDIPAEMYERLSLDPEKAAEAVERVIESSADLELMASNMAA